MEGGEEAVMINVITSHRFGNSWRPL